MKFRTCLFIGLATLIALVAGGLVLIFVLLGPRDTELVNEDLVSENRLFIPPQLQPRIENGEKVFDLTAQEGETEFFEGKSTSTWGYNGSYLGPTIRARTGDKVRINVTNNLGETTTVHWHGMHLPAMMDGGPHQPIEPGETWQPYWTITNQAATLWYHPHQMGSTGEHVYRGLAGLFIIDDENSDLLDIPNQYGVDDIPLIVQDRLFDGSGQLIYRRHGQNEALPGPAGMLGDTILVNGTHAPFIEVPTGLIRLRLLNASNGRRYNFGFSDDRPFHQIATDGGLLESPVERTRMLLGVGERTEILVDLSDATVPITLMSYAVPEDGNAIVELVERTFGEDDENQQFRILELRPASGAAQGTTGSQAARQIPQTLNTIERLGEGDAVETRRFTLDARTINNKTMDHARVDQIVKKGDIEIWTIDNQSPFYHPFHVHGVQFLVLDRDGRDTPAHEQGWKDTVIVNPGEVVRVIMQFKDYSDPTLPYMFHCHILEHEDMGMMGQFVVVDSLTDDVRIKSPLTEEPEAQHMHP